MAERAVAVPALERLGSLEPLGSCTRVALPGEEPLEPGNTPEAVAMLPRRIGLLEVGDDDPGIRR